MSGRVFQLEEARALLPRVKALMDQVQDARREVADARSELTAVQNAAHTNGGSYGAGRAVAELRQIEVALHALQELGVVVKDIENGLVDFVGIRGGEQVYLCWQYGEEDLKYWHGLNDGYAGRQPIDEKVQ
jgi:hypothetical protein